LESLTFTRLTPLFASALAFSKRSVPFVVIPVSIPLAVKAYAISDIGKTQKMVSQATPRFF